jgi:uncharacterized protein YggU (UPF0235/DUF167 family)
VVPGSAREGVAGLYGDRVKIRVRAIADRNAANEALCTLIAKAAVVPGSAVRIVLGGQSRSKTLLVTSPDPERTAERLHRAMTETVDSRRGRA